MSAALTEQDLDMFGRGGCWALAQAVHDLTGWPMRAFRRGGEPGGHVFVETPDGAFLDIRGASPRGDFLERWGENADSLVPLQDTSDWTLPRWFNFRRWDRDTCLARAREVAPGIAAAAAKRDAGRRASAKPRAAVSALPVARSRSRHRAEGSRRSP